MFNQDRDFISNTADAWCYRLQCITHSSQYDHVLAEHLLHPFLIFITDICIPCQWQWRITETLNLCTRKAVYMYSFLSFGIHPFKTRKILV